MNSFLRAGDFVKFRSFPAVIQSADIRALRDVAARSSDDEALADFCGGYLGYDDRARYALEASLKALSGNGGAFFFNGVFGSGKSHLLGLLALLADGTGWNAFLESHPHLRPLQEMPPRLVVHFSLDNWSAAEHSLEAICWRETGDEWQRRFGESLPVASPTTSGARSETFAALEELCAARGLSGCALFIDELSLFLGGREHHLLQQDAAWLQFLGQRARRSHQGFFAIFAALQKTVEDIGDVDSYAISQIRDRYQTLPLSLAHLPSLIERRLVLRRDAQGLQRFNYQAYDQLGSVFSRLDFGREEWDKSFPFHPATIALLEQIAPRYFSRTRSAVLFCQRAAHADSPAARRVLPPELFDDIVDELPLHPDLKPIHAAWLQWQDDEQAAARDETEASHLRDCFKTLALWRIGGGAPTVAQVVNSLLLSTGLRGDAAYEYGRILLEKLRAHAPVALERRDGEFQDRYALDFGTRVSDLTRRFIGNALANFAPRDGRVARYVLSCSRDEALPLASLDATSPAPLWRNAPRRVAVFVTPVPPAPDVLANRIAALASPSETDWLLFLAPPFNDCDAQSWREAVREAILRAETETRWRGAVAWWLPREASEDEWAQAREATAQHTLMSDPQLFDNRRGRAVLEYLKAGLAERETQLGRIAVRLLFEGTLFNGAGAVIDGGDLAAGNSNWSATLEALADWTLPTAFPRWPAIAPRARVLTESSAQTLGLEILRRPINAPYFAPSHERLVRAIGEPLGIAHAEAGRWKMDAPQGELRAFFADFIAANAPATLASLEAHAAKSEWGIVPEMTRLCVCALLRSGEIVGLDARGQSVAPEEIGLPLARSIRALAPGKLPDEAAWEVARNSTVLLANADIGARTYAAQNAARATLELAREEWRANAELFSARLHQLKRAQGGDWRECDAAREAISQLIHALEGDILAVASQLDNDILRTPLETFSAWSQRLETGAAQLVEAQLFLAHPQMAAPAALQSSRASLLERLSAGESALRDAELLHDFSQWREDYGRIYASWHREQNDATQLKNVRRLAGSDALRALDAWDSLPSRAEKFAPQIRERIRDEADTLCARDGNIGREPVCASCRLRLGEEIKFEVAAIEAQLEAARNEIQSVMESNRAALPAQAEAGESLLKWLDQGETLEKLWPLLNQAGLRALEKTFADPAQTAPVVELVATNLARTSSARSFTTLRDKLVTCRTRAEAERAFGLWLDSDAALAPEDEFACVD